MQTVDAANQGDSVEVTVKLPADIARRYGGNSDQIALHLLEQAAAEGYRNRELSRGQVARLLRMDWAETEEFLARHACYRHYDLEELQKDREDLDKMFGPA